MSTLVVDVSHGTGVRSLDPLCVVAEIEECDFSKLPDKARALCIERQKSFDERSLSELSSCISPRLSSKNIETFRVMDHLESMYSPGRWSGLNTPHSQHCFEPHPMVTEAWDALRHSLVYFRDQPVGTIAALDHSEEALNYNQVFVRDFFPSALAFLMNGEPEIVKNFLLKTLRLQSWEKRIDQFKLGEGVMPASFKVLHDPVRNYETLIADFGESAIGRVAPVDSGFWWIILLRAYTKSTGDTSLAERPECQKGMRLILSLCLSEGFDTFPTLLCADGCCMIDRRMLDVKNAFLHGDLQEEVYMEQPPGYVSSQGSSLVCRLRKAIYGLKQSPRAWFDKFSGVVLQLGFSRFHADHSVFIRRTSGRLVVLAVYVDDIIITGDDVGGIQDLKSHLHTHFHTKDLGLLRYFLGIEVARSRGRMVLSQRKYVTDLLEETGMSGTKPMDTPMEQNVKLDAESGEIFDDPGQYRRLVGKLIYLTVTRPGIAFAVGIVSQFMHAPRQPHWEAVCRILRYLKAAPGRGLVYRSSGHLRVSGYSDADWAGQSDRRSISGYCTFVGGNLVTWRSKKQNVVARSSAEAEYRAMAHTTSEMLWVHSLVEALGFATNNPMEMFCDNQAAIRIANNPMFHERTKHVEVDCHFIRDMVIKKCITTPFVRSADQLGDIFTKALGRVPFDELCNKLGLLDIYVPA